MIELGVLLGVAAWTWRVWKLRRETLRRAGDPVAIEGRTRPWGWPRPPEPFLRVENQGTSVLFLPARYSTAEVVGSLFGAGLLLFFLLALFRSLVDGDGGATLVVGAIFGLFGWALLHSQSRLVRVELTPETASFYSRYAMVLYERARLSGASARRARFEAQMQGLHEVERGQRRLETRLIVTRRFPGLRLFLDCELREAEFVVRGLREWQASLEGAGEARRD